MYANKQVRAYVHIDVLMNGTHTYVHIIKHTESQVYSDTGVQ